MDKTHLHALYESLIPIISDSWIARKSRDQKNRNSEQYLLKVSRHDTEFAGTVGAGGAIAPLTFLDSSI